MLYYHLTHHAYGPLYDRTCTGCQRSRTAYLASHNAMRALQAARGQLVSAPLDSHPGPYCQCDICKSRLP